MTNQTDRVHLTAASPRPSLDIGFLESSHDSRAVDRVLTALRLFLDRCPEAAAATMLRVVGSMAATQAQETGARIASLRLGPNTQVTPDATTDPFASVNGWARCVIIAGRTDDPTVPTALVRCVESGTTTIVWASWQTAIAREGRRLGALVIEPVDIEGVIDALTAAWHGADIRPRASGTPSGHPGASGDEMFGRESLDHHLEGEPRINWMWLANPPQWKRALELSVGESRLAGALRLRFEQVETLDCIPLIDDADPLGLAAVDRAVRFPFEDASFDCVTMHDVCTALMQRSAPRARLETRMLGECARILRPGGCLYLADRNARYRRFLAPLGADGVNPGEMTRALRRAGFARQHAYYVAPSHIVPRTIIPGTWNAAWGYECFVGGGGVRNGLRRALALSGLHEVLHPSIAFLAYR